jgi:hypothetical protein
MTLLSPDDFKDRPYVAGLNQIGHAVLGGALMVVASIFMPLIPATILVGLGIIAWEAYQLKRMAGLKSDYWGDLLFWAIGLFGFSFNPFLPFIALAGGAWMIYMGALK